MKTTLPQNFLKLSIVALSCVVASCGGGGGGGVASLESSALTVSGVAATGAPISNGTLQIYDKNGTALLGTPASVDATTGAYSATIPATATGPFVFEVNSGSDKIYSVLANKSGSSVVNVTPLSNLVAAKLSTTGNPYTLVNEITTSSATVSTGTIAAATTTIMTALQPLATALSIDSSVNPISSTFTANGTGLDRMLDSLDVKIEPKGTSSQIEITMKQAVDESQDLPKISFANSSTPAALPTVDPTKLVSSGLTPKIQALLDKLTACYADPLATRIASGGTSAADILSQNCKDAFFGSNPAGYKANGYVIAKTGGHYGGIFTADSSAGVTFSDPKFFYTVGTSVPGGPAQGDIVFGYRWKDEYGNFQFEKNVGRLDTDGKLKLIGNQYQYDGGVGAYSQRRNYINQPASTFNSTGYSFSLSCYQLYANRSAGNKIVKVNVTAPNNQMMTLIPNHTGNTCNYSYFVIAFSKDKTGAPTVDGMNEPAYATGTGFIRLQTLYETGATTDTNHPRQLDKGLAYVGGFNGTDFTNAQMEAIPQFGTWKFEYYKTNTAGSLPVATQYYKTTSRASTVDGFKQSVKLPRLTASALSALTTNTTCYSNTSLYCYFLQAAGPFVTSWTKTTDGGLAPATYMARIYGVEDISVTPTSNWVGYANQLQFGSSRSSASILCGQDTGSVQSYCAGASAPVATFKSTTSIDAIDLVSRAPDGTDVSHFHTLKKLQ